MLELTIQEDRRGATISITSEDQLDDEDIYLALEDYLQNYATVVSDGGESVH